MFIPSFFLFLALKIYFCTPTKEPIEQFYQQRNYGKL